MVAGLGGEMGDGLGREVEIEARNLHDRGDTC